MAIVDVNPRRFRSRLEIEFLHRRAMLITQLLEKGRIEPGALLSKEPIGDAQVVSFARRVQIGQQVPVAGMGPVAGIVFRCKTFAICAAVSPRAPA